MCSALSQQLPSDDGLMITVNRIQKGGGYSVLALEYLRTYLNFALQSVSFEWGAQDK